jgi:quercetin dioxygenase-like cupin family protein
VSIRRTAGTDGSTRYVFSTRDTIRYRFPPDRHGVGIHTNYLILDRSDAVTSEAFWTVLEPGQSPPVHVHPEVEQLLYVTEGAGELTVGSATLPLAVGDLVRVPAGTPHAVAARGEGRVLYLTVDCFLAGRPSAEPSWDSHVQAQCAEEGWSFEEVRQGPARLL